MSGWSVFVEKFIGNGVVMEDMPFDLRRDNCGFFQPLTEGGGIAVRSITSLSEALALVDRRLLALLGCEMLNAERHERDPSSSTSSSDSTGVRVGGIVYSPLGCGFCVKKVRGEEDGDIRRGNEHCFCKKPSQHNALEALGG